jgi:hypothetical protein
MGFKEKGWTNLFVSCPLADKSIKDIEPYGCSSILSVGYLTK